MIPILLAAIMPRPPEVPMKKRFWLVLAATLPCTAQAQAVVTERTLSLDAAREAAAAALERCRKDGYQVTVTVLNRAGRTKVVMHDDGVRAGRNRPHRQGARELK